MNRHTISGLETPKNPKERSDAISLEYLERYLESQHLSKAIEEAPVQPQTTHTEAYLLCSTGLSHEVDCPLPLELLSQGILGFTWGAKSPRYLGKFPMNSLQYSSSDEERSCFVLDDDVLYGKYPGIYTWELTLKALIPSILDYSHPCIQLKIYYNYLAWNSKEELQGNMSSIEVPLHCVGTTTIGGCNYDIVELPAGNARVFTVPKHCGGVSIHLENTKEGAFAEDLYIITSSIQL
ncbi:Uncharacterised protein [Chlamydia abortus]|nr:Uncharacterised protein [Chlamydia abortus]